MRRKCRASPSGSAGVQGSRTATPPVCSTSRVSGRASMDRRLRAIESPHATQQAGRMQSATSGEAMMEKLRPTLVLGGTGKTGRRVVERLRARRLPVRVGSRSGTPPFDWDDRSTWAPALSGVGSAYVSYHPDLAVPGAVDTVGSFAEL